MILSSRAKHKLSSVFGKHFYGVHLKTDERNRTLRTSDAVNSLLFFVSVLVKLDAFVTADQTLTELSKALKVSSFSDSKLGICLQKLDATCLGEPKLNILLGQINPQVYIDLPCPCIIVNVLLYIFFILLCG